MATNADELQYTNITRIAGQSEEYALDVSNQNGKYRANVESVDVLNSNLVTGQLTVGTSAVEAKVGASRLSNRRVVTIYNDSSNTIYFGNASVTTSIGLPIVKNQTLTIDVGDVSIYLIASSTGNDVIVVEGA